MPKAKRPSTRFTLGFDREQHVDHGVLATGFEVIDTMLMLDFQRQPLGGLPRGGVYEISGSKESGKSRLCYYIGAEEQRNGGRVALGDAENRMVLSGGQGYISGCGVSFDAARFVHIPPNDRGLYLLESMFAAVIELAEGEVASLIIIDSLAALQPVAIQAYIDDPNKREDDKFISGQSGVVAQAQQAALREAVPICAKHGTTVLMINHRRKSPSQYEPDYSPGGTAKDHLLNASLFLKRVGREDDTGDIEVSVRVEKSNVSMTSGQRTGTKGGIPNIILATPRVSEL
jgi:RecA/RadA recombinase